MIVVMSNTHYFVYFLEQMIKYTVPYMGKASLCALLAGNIVL